MIDAKSRAGLDAAIELMHFAYRELVAKPDRVLAGRGLGRAHHRILYLLAKLRAPSVAELIAALGISKQAASTGRCATCTPSSSSATNAACPTPGSSDWR